MATQFLTPANTAAIPRVAPQEEQSSMMENIAFAAFGFYLFLVFSRMPELTAMRFGSSFGQILISSILCMVMIIVSGTLAKVIGSRLSILLIALHVWYFASFPFSYWKTGTLEALITNMKVLPLVFFIMASIQTEKHLRKTFTIMRVAMLISLVFTMIAPPAEASDGRLQLEGGRFANSNEIAVYLLLGLPFWLHMSAGQRFPMVLRILAGVEIGLTIFQCLRTGSRGGLITIMLLAVIVFTLSSAVNKLKLVVLGLAVVLLAVPLLPSSVRTRLYSITGEAHDGGAQGSSESRFALLMESIVVAAKHPLFGVGIGVYAEAAAELSAKAGRRKLWQVSHNSYAQVGAEAGFPALFLFLACLGVSWKSLWRSRNYARRFREMQELALMNNCMLLTLFVFIVNACFGNMAQELFFYLACGVAFACSEVTARRYDALVRAETENIRLTTEAAMRPGGTTGGDAVSHLRPAYSGFANHPVPATSGATAKKPASEPVVGRPKPVAPESMYGDVPWARNPNRQ